jgi:hypothetical protein
MRSIRKRLPVNVTEAQAAAAFHYLRYRADGHRLGWRCLKTPEKIVSYRQ